jgi:hypothetical protein
MSKTLLHRLFGLGKMPRKYASTLRAEGIILIDEGIGGSITLKRFKAPGRRYSWKRSWFTGCLVLTNQTFAAFTLMRPLVFIPLTDKRLSELRCSVEESVTLLITYDASLFNEKWSGIVECRFKTSKAQLFLEQLVRYAT